MTDKPKPRMIGGVEASAISDIARHTVDEVERALMRTADLAPPSARPAIVLNVAFQMFYRAAQTVAMCEHTDPLRANIRDESVTRYARQIADCWKLFPDEEAVHAAIAALMASTLLKRST